MGWKQRLFSNMFFRNMLADFGERSAYSKVPGQFIPFFQYKIAPYQADSYLYFPTEPFAVRYKNEIFNKLNEYTGYDIIKFLEFHFSAYPDKQDFIRFLNYEISERLKRTGQGSRHLKLESALNWVNEKNQELKQSQEEQLRGEIEKGVQEIIKSNANPNNVDSQVKALSEKLSSHVEKVMAETENGIRDLTGSFVTGNIQLNNRNHEERIIQLMILLQQVQAPPEVAKAEQLFKKFTASDIASILHLHFEAYRDNKINTLCVK